MLNTETGDEVDETISPGRVTVNNQLLNNQQSFLDNQHAYLRGKTVVTLAAVVGTRYYNVPDGIDFDRLEEPVFTNMKGFHYEMEYGIKQSDYNVFQSDIGQTSSYVYRWQLINIAGTLKIELWPVPSVAQTIEFTGLLKLTQMAADSDTCVVDDLVLVLFTAAEILARGGAGDAGAKAAKAKAALDSIRASFPSRYERFNIAGIRPWWDRWCGNGQRPVVGISGDTPPANEVTMIIMIPETAFNVAAFQATATPISVLRIRGNFNGAVDGRWLQIFDSATTPADGTAPLIVGIPLTAGSPFFIETEVGSLAFAAGCYVCVSNTRAAKTLSADTMDVTVETYDPNA